MVAALCEGYANLNCDDFILSQCILRQDRYTISPPDKHSEEHGTWETVPKLKSMRNLSGNSQEASSHSHNHVHCFIPLALPLSHELHLHTTH